MVCSAKVCNCFCTLAICFSLFPEMSMLDRKVFQVAVAELSSPAMDRIPFDTVLIAELATAMPAPIPSPLLNLSAKESVALDALFIMAVNPESAADNTAFTL